MKHWPREIRIEIRPSLPFGEDVIELKYVIIEGDNKVIYTKVEDIDCFFSTYDTIMDSIKEKLIELMGCND